MTHQHALEPEQAAGATGPGTLALPVVRTLRPADLLAALREGWDDFRAMPSHALFLTVIYPLIGLLLGRALLGYEFLPLLFPLAAGFALVGPLAAVGLYELSRRREAGLSTSWEDMAEVFASPSRWSILALGLVLLVIFAIWIAVAHSIYVSYFGYREPTSLSGFLREVLNTPAGRSLMIVGNGVGFLFALLVLVISAVSFPLLLDRPVGAVGAALTSVRVCLKNPVTMALWGFIVAGALALGSLPFLLGLPLVLPVLGHATWHLYRRAVEPDANPRPAYRRPAREPRYAADFPLALFPTRRRREP